MCGEFAEKKTMFGIVINKLIGTRQDIVTTSKLEC